MKRFLLPLLALGMTVLLPLVYFRFTPFAIGDVVVSARPSCDDAMDGKRRVSSAWSGGALLVEVSEAMACGLTRQSVAVQKICRRLFVRTAYASPGGELAACLCRHDFTLKVPDVPRQDYDIIVYSVPCPVRSACSPPCAASWCSFYPMLPTTMTPLDETLASIAHVMFPGDDVPREIRLDTRASDGDTPLHVFAWRKDLQAARLLIAAGADTNAIGDMGETPLHVSVRQDLPELARALLAAGASPDIVSEFEESARNMALRKGGELADIFRAFGV